MNIPREDFTLRTETNWLFKEVGIDTHNLLFFPEIQKDFDLLKENKCVDLILVDHNRLSVPQEKYESLVTEIIDHHKDEEKSPKAKRTIEMVGSCSTLITERILSQSSFLTSLDAKILLSPILLDTVNMDPIHKKATQKDIEIASKLNKIIEFNLEQKNTFFDKLQFERFSVESLNSYDLLRMDYKQWTMGSIEVGISSVKRSIKEWKIKDSLLIKELEKYFLERKLNLLIVMTQYLDSQKNMFREVIIFTPKKENLFEKTKEFLVPTELNLVEMNVQKDDYFITGFFEQKNITASRKQMQPLLVELYQ